MENPDFFCHTSNMAPDGDVGFSVRDVRISLKALPLCLNTDSQSC